MKPFLARLLAIPFVLFLISPTTPARAASSFYTEAESMVDFGACYTGNQQRSQATCASGGVAGIPGQYNYISESSTSLSSLAKGALEARAITSMPYGAIYGTKASAGANLYDTLTFYGPISPGDIVTVTMSAGVHYDGDYGAGYLLMEMIDPSWNGVLAEAWDCTPTDTFSTQCITTLLDKGNYSIRNTGDEYSISESMDLSDVGADGLAILLQVGVIAEGNSSAYVIDPISITLPPGVTYSTASGFPLTGSAASVREPGGLSLFLIGVLGCWLSRGGRVWQFTSRVSAVSRCHRA